MHYDFSGVADPESFVSVPAGSYVCRIAEVRPGRTRDDHARWALRLEVADGEHAGRTAAWDGLVWSERGARRVKHVLASLGFEVEGALEIDTKDLLGLRARVELREEEWYDPVTGNRILRLSVPYLGWAPANGPESARVEPWSDG